MGVRRPFRYPFLEQDLAGRGVIRYSHACCIICSIVIGLIFLRIDTRRGFSSCLTDAETLPEELRTGLIPEDKRESIGEEAFSSISVSTLTFHLSAISFIVLCGYLISKAGAKAAPGLELPVFSCAYIVGVIISLISRRHL